MFVDSHCHLDFPDYSHDLSVVLRSAHQNDVNIFINPSIDLLSSRNCLDFVQKYPGIYTAVGVHPNDIGSHNPQFVINNLEKLLGNRKLVAIGEIGLDYYHKTTDIFLQKDVFSAQLEFAIKNKLPVIIHSRDALGDVMDVIRSYYPQNADAAHKNNGVLHAFEGNLDSAKIAASYGFLIGIGGPITYKNAHVKHQLAIDLPLENILLETDCPFLSPVPYRGKRNEPANIKIIAEKLANLKECDIKQVETQTTMNALSLFNIGAEIDCY